MPEQGFRELVEELRPTLKKISSRKRFLGFIDSDDLYQEALINLWRRSAIGELRDKTSSYILRGCYFHIQNYIRTHKVRNNVFSLDEPVNFEDSDVFCLKDIIVDDRVDLSQEINNRLIVDKMLNNGLTRREKDVLRLLYAGLNLREAARRLGVSHVRVLKIKKNIASKYSSYYQEGAPDDGPARART